MNKLLKSQKNQTVQNDPVLEELIKKDINANKNRAENLRVNPYRLRHSKSLYA